MFLSLSFEIVPRYQTLKLPVLRDWSLVRGGARGGGGATKSENCGSENDMPPPPPPHPPVL